MTFGTPKESQEVSSFSKIPILGYSLNGDHGSDPINVDVEENSSVPTITQPSTLSTRASSVAVEEIRDEDKKRNGQHIVNPGPDGPILESIDNNVLLGDYDPSWEEEVDENLYSKFSRQVDDAVNEELSNGKTEHLYIYVSDSDDDVVLVPTTLHPGEQKAGNLSDSDQETKAQESAKKRSSHLLAKEIQGVRKAERRSASQAVQDEYDGK